MKIHSTLENRWLIRTAVCLAALGSFVKAHGESPAAQAIEQAPDPSAAVTAYANGVANDSHDPKIHEAYVRRMVLVAALWVLGRLCLLTVWLGLRVW